MSRPFFFRYFCLQQHGCAMKAGTDSMLLGATALPAGAQRILDVGTGTGILSLMLAQKSKARIDAIDMEADAVKQAAENFDNSTWSHRLHAIHANAEEYLAGEAEVYDLVISNPPYFAPPPAHFSTTTKGHIRGRIKARSHAGLSYEKLLEHTARLLARKGRFWCIIPTQYADEFEAEAERKGLYPEKIWQIESRPGTGAIRTIYCMAKEKTRHVITTTWAIYASENNFSDAYIALTEIYHATELRRSS